MSESRTHRILKQHLATDALLGVDAVPVGEKVKKVEIREVAGEQSVERSVAVPVMSREAKLKVMQAMDREEVSVCRKCELCHGRTQTVFGEGDVDARIMFIGEGPGQNEDEQGRPFVGRAGELLEKMIVAMGLSREQVYIANVVKCRPPNNRAPTPLEVQTCWDYLVRQIETIRPQVIVTLGGPAAKAVLSTNEGVTKIRGQWFAFPLNDGSRIAVMPTFHPAYLLRAYTPENRAKVWSDLQQVMAKVGLKEKG